MEHAQRGGMAFHRLLTTNVLILILMEHAQRGRALYSARHPRVCVLILILMEHAQRDVLPLTVVNVPVSWS